MSEDKAKEILMFLAKKNMSMPYIKTYCNSHPNLRISGRRVLNDMHRIKFCWYLDFKDDLQHVISFPMRIADERMEFEYPYFIFTKEFSYEECLEKVIETVSKMDKKRNVVIDGAFTLAHIGTTLEQILVEMDLGNRL